jgi:hypothetical protein
MSQRRVIEVAEATGTERPGRQKHTYPRVGECQYAR